MDGWMKMDGGRGDKDEWMDGWRDEDGWMEEWSDEDGWMDRLLK